MYTAQSSEKSARVMGSSTSMPRSRSAAMSGPVSGSSPTPTKQLTRRVPSGGCHRASLGERGLRSADRSRAAAADCGAQLLLVRRVRRGSGGVGMVSLGLLQMGHRTIMDLVTVAPSPR